ncbi:MULTISPECIES: hypothetical protein [Clostridia]|uniref:hypothetical protein n=1 Tax=Clostridia TaxID=186801 RepID=UPI00067F42A7|nr:MULTISPECIES: hypothetical protein [Clostridia]
MPSSADSLSGIPQCWGFLQFFSSIWQEQPFFQGPFSLIFRLYKQQFLKRSIHKGLIDPEHLVLAGDGPPVRTAAQQQKNGSAIVRKKPVLPVTANAIIPSRTATADGTLIGNAISSVTTYEFLEDFVFMKKNAFLYAVLLLPKHTCINKNLMDIPVLFI